jgi:hypothetical protein
VAGVGCAFNPWRLAETGLRTHCCLMGTNSRERIDGHSIRHSAARPATILGAACVVVTAIAGH